MRNLVVVQVLGFQCSVHLDLWANLLECLFGAIDSSCSTRVFRCRFFIVTFLNTGKKRTAFVRFVWRYFSWRNVVLFHKLVCKVFGQAFKALINLHSQHIKAHSKNNSQCNRTFFSCSLAFGGLKQIRMELI